MPARVSSQFSAHVSGQLQGRSSIPTPHTKHPRCNHRNTGRRRVTVTPNTTHRMNSRCNARIAAANAEYTLPLPYEISAEQEAVLVETTLHSTPRHATHW